MAQAINVAQCFNYNLIQVVNDQFIQLPITTGLLNVGAAGNNTTAIRIIGIEVEMPDIPAVNAADAEVCFYRRTKAIMPNLEDADVIHKFRQRASFVTSGAFLQDKVQYWSPQSGDIIIVEDPIYVGLDTNATAALSRSRGRIDYEFVTISQTSRLQILARSLGA